MDDLEENFPHLFAKPDQIRDARKAAASLKLAGDCGHAADTAAKYHVETVQCDEKYLHSLIKTLDSAKIKFFSFMVEYPALRQFRPAPEDINGHCRSALGDVMKVVEELQRLHDHPELFGDIRVQREMFQAARKSLVALLDLTKLKTEVTAVFKHADEAYRTLAPRATLDNGEECPPWLSWCRSMTMKEGNPVQQRLQEAHPDMIQGPVQLLPPQGLLIAERRRQQLETKITRVMERSPDPARVEKQMPPPQALVTDWEPKEGIGANWKERSGAIIQTERVQKRFAFGPQEPVAELARFLGFLEGDITTRYDPSGVLRGAMVCSEQLENGQEDDARRELAKLQMPELGSY